jgi:predicted aspartyl protease
MNFPFEPRFGLIMVSVTLHGPAARGRIRLALDTGATFTLIGPSALISTGYDPAGAGERVEITTATGIEYVARLRVTRMIALGRERLNFPVLVHTLPPSAGIDGLLGLDFLRGQRLSIDFSKGEISFD